MFESVFDVAKAAFGLMLAIATIVMVVAMGAAMALIVVWGVIRLFGWLF